MFLTHLQYRTFPLAGLAGSRRQYYNSNNVQWSVYELINGSSGLKKKGGKKTKKRKVHSVTHLEPINWIDFTHSGVSPVRFSSMLVSKIEESVS